MIPISWLFPWLLKQAMKMGTKRWGQTDTGRHAMMSRSWMWRNVWSPMIVKMKKSPTTMDDPLIEFVETYNVSAIEDGSVEFLLTEIIQEVASTNRPDMVVRSVNELRGKLGMDHLR